MPRGVSPKAWTAAWSRPGAAMETAGIILQFISRGDLEQKVIGLDDGNIYRKALYLMGNSMVSCRFSHQPIH
jgi:hypothetical protein